MTLTLSLIDGKIFTPPPAVYSKRNTAEVKWGVVHRFSDLALLGPSSGGFS